MDELVFVRSHVTAVSNLSYEVVQGSLTFTEAKNLLYQKFGDTILYEPVPSDVYGREIGDGAKKEERT